MSVTFKESVQYPHYIAAHFHLSQHSRSLSSLPSLTLTPATYHAGSSLYLLLMHPITLSIPQFLIGSLLACTMWASGVIPRPKVTQATIIKTLPLAIAHTLGNVLTNVSLGLVSLGAQTTLLRAPLCLAQ